MAINAVPPVSGKDGTTIYNNDPNNRRDKIFASSQSSDASLISFHKLAKKGKIEEAIIVLLEKKKALSLSALQDLLAPYMEVEGDSPLYRTQDENIRIWERTSLELATLIIKLTNEDKILMPQGIEYAAFYAEDDPRKPKYPLMDENDKVTSKHWLPTIIKQSKLAPLPVT